MIRGTVARYGDADITCAVADGMAAAKLQRELDDLRMREADWGVHDVRWRNDLLQKITDAKLDYGYNPRISKIHRAILGFYGLIIWAIHITFERLKAKNREA